MNKPPFSTIAVAGLKAIVVAVLVNVSLFFVWTAAGLLDRTFLLPNTNAPLTAVQVAMATAIPMVTGTLLFALLVRFTRTPVRIFTIIAIGFGLLSLASPFTIPGVPLPYALALGTMHVAPVAALVWFMRKTEAGQRIVG